MLINILSVGGVAEWLRRSVPDLARPVRVGSNPAAFGTTSQQSTQLSNLPRSVNEYSEVTLRAKAPDTLITANLISNSEK